MRSPRPYLIRALIDWIVDNGWTPHLLVAADVEGVAVPRGYVKDERIVLNVSARAVRGFDCGDEAVSFDSRFGGQPFHVVVPLEGILAVYARETGGGLAFQGAAVSGSFPVPTDGTDGEQGYRPGLRTVEAESSSEAESGDQRPKSPGDAKGPPKLTVVD